MSGILGRTLLAGAVLLASTALAAAQTSGGTAGAGAGGAGAAGAGATGASGAGSASPAPAMTSPGPADPSSVIQPAPTSSVGKQVPIHGMSDMSTPSLSNTLDQSSGRSSGIGCGSEEAGTATSGASRTGTSADSSGCGINSGNGDLRSLSIMNSGSSSAIDVSKP